MERSLWLGEKRMSSAIPILKDMTHEELYKLQIKKADELDNILEEIRILADFMSTKYEKDVGEKTNE